MSNTFRYTIAQTVDEWLKDVLTYQEGIRLVSEASAAKLDKLKQQVMVLHESSRLVKQTNRNRPLYHYELQGPHLTHMLLIDPEFIENLETRTKNLLIADAQ